MRLIDQLLTRDVDHAAVILAESQRRGNRATLDADLTDKEVEDVMRRFGLDPDTDIEAMRDIIDAKMGDLVAELKQAERDRRVSHQNFVAESQKMLDTCAELAVHATVIDAQNVYRYLRSPAGATDVYELPGCAPKWPVTWVEYTQDNGTTIGVLAFYKERGKDDEELMPDLPVEDLARTANGFLPSVNGLWYSDHLPDRAAWEDIRWCMNLTMFSRNDRVALGAIANWRVAISERGQIRDMIWGTEEFIDPEETVDFVRVWAQTMAFLNLRNVRTVYREPSRQQQKVHRKKRRAEHPLMAWRQLRIDPIGPKNGTRSETDRDGESLEAFHIHPGSFAHYGACCDPSVHAPKGLLFGKLQGVYWRPAHIKGNIRNGIKIQDYEVGALEGS